jgi:hypothetical protein
MTLYATDLRGRTVAASDAKVGAFDDMLLDDLQWSVRFLAVCIGGGSTQRLVLVPSAMICRGGLSAGMLRLDRSRRQVDDASERNAVHHARPLLSAQQTLGYVVEAADGAVGMVDDLTVDDQSWSLSGVAIDGRRWWPGRRLWARAAEIADIDRDRRTMRVSVTRATLCAAAL